MNANEQRFSGIRLAKYFRTQTSTAPQKEVPHGQSSREHSRKRILPPFLAQKFFLFQMINRFRRIFKNGRGFGCLKNEREQVLREKWKCSMFQFLRCFVEMRKIKRAKVMNLKIFRWQLKNNVCRKVIRVRQCLKTYLQTLYLKN